MAGFKSLISPHQLLRCLETTIVTDGEALAVEVTPDDKTLFVAMGEAGVASYDIASTQSPSLESTFSNGQSAVNLFLASTGLYHDPGCTSPMLRGYCHYLFIADGDEGVFVCGGNRLF